MIGIGLGLSFIKGGGNSAESLAWKMNIEANGGTISQALLDIFDQNFFIPAKANGNILTELDRLNIYCGLAGYEIAARTNLIKNAHYVTPVSSPTFDNNGYASSGTSYLDLNYNASSQGVKYTRNSASYGYVVKNPTYSTQRRAIGAINAGPTIRADIQRDTPGNSGQINDIIASTDTNKPTGKVFSAVIRTSSNSTKLITNTSETSGTASSTGLVNFNVFELGLNFAGTPTSPFDTASHLASFHGSGALDYVNLRIILNNLFTALGV